MLQGSLACKPLLLLKVLVLEIPELLLSYVTAVPESTQCIQIRKQYTKQCLMTMKALLKDSTRRHDRVGTRIV